MHGLDGYQATQAIRKWEKERGMKRSKIIGMTAYALTGDRENAWRREWTITCPSRSIPRICARNWSYPRACLQL